MINDEANKCYYFAVKNLSGLNSLGWWRVKKAIINGDNDFQNALDDALNYQTIETHPERMSKLKPYINKYNWEGIDLPAGSKECQKLNEIIKQLRLMYYIYHTTKKQYGLHIGQNNSKRKKQVILLMITDCEKCSILL